MTIPRYVKYIINRFSYKNDLEEGCINSDMSFKDYCKDYCKDIPILAEDELFFVAPTPMYLDKISVDIRSRKAYAKWWNKWRRRI